MDAISQTAFSNAFSWMKIYQFRQRFHRFLFVRFELTIFHHWFREWLGTVQATNHYLNQWWLVYLHIYVTWSQWVNAFTFHWYPFWCVLFLEICRNVSCLKLFSSTGHVVLNNQWQQILLWLSFSRGVIWSIYSYLSASFLWHWDSRMIDQVPSN